MLFKNKKWTSNQSYLFMMAICHDINFLQYQHPEYVWIHLQDTYYQGFPFPSYILGSSYLLCGDVIVNTPRYQMLITDLYLIDASSHELFFHLFHIFLSSRSSLHGSFNIGTMIFNHLIFHMRSYYVDFILSICGRVQGVGSNASMSCVVVTVSA